MFVEHQTSSHDPPEIKDVSNDAENSALITDCIVFLCSIVIIFHNITVLIVFWIK